MNRSLKSVAGNVAPRLPFSHALKESVRRLIRPVFRVGARAALQTAEVNSLVAARTLDEDRWAEPLYVGSRVDKGTQILLALKYKELVHNKLPLPSFADVGFRAFSQFDEDGILLYIFSLIGMTTRKAVEICAGLGFECIGANLIINHGFHALLFDGNIENIKLMWRFFTKRSDTQISQPLCAHAWIESDSVDEQIRSRGYVGEIDLLAIDMDGIDYWILKAIQCVHPRVVVVEYHSGWLADEPMTVPDIKGFTYSEEKPAFCSASLAAYNKLLTGRGYRLVGCNSNRLNAFFVRNGLGDDLLPAVPVESCLEHPRLTWFRNTYRPHMLKQTDWVLC
jgi:hypothetical protein